MISKVSALLVRAQCVHRQRSNGSSTPKRELRRRIDMHGCYDSGCLSSRVGYNNMAAVAARCCGSRDLTMYETTNRSTFQDPALTLGFGATTRAEKLKEAAIKRGTPVPLMVQFETFDDANIERTSSQSEYGFDRLLPSKQVIKAADHFLSTTQQSYGGQSRKFIAEAKLARTGTAPVAVGRSGTRTERGKGMVDTFKLGDRPQDNSLVQGSWTYDLAPAFKARLAYGGRKPEPPLPEGVSLRVGSEMDDNTSQASCGNHARKQAITYMATWKEASLRPGRPVFMDDP